MAKKLIEVALPLEEINKECVRGKHIHHGHPSTLHLWWARRPLAAARAVIWASLVDDPSAHPDLFPTEEAQNEERERLFNILKELVVWENSNNEEILARAKAEIMKSTDNNPPALLDPFAGGGAIPLEALRLGLEAHAHDLNPVAVMINKAMIEIPSRFANRQPVNPESRSLVNTQWRGAEGLAEDVLYYGKRLRDEAFKQAGALYPKMRVGDEEATVVAWIWARTVNCPNPACGCEMPLVKGFSLCSKKGKERCVQIEPRENGFIYTVKHGNPSVEGTVSRTGAKCAKCGCTVGLDYIREEGKKGRIKAQLMAVVVETPNGKEYCSPNDEQERAADIPEPDNAPASFLPEKALGFRVQLYGMDQYKKLFSNRQLKMLTTLSDLVSSLRVEIERDAVAFGMKNDSIPLSQGGYGALAYSQAVAVYIAFVVDKMADFHSSICSWLTHLEAIRNTFVRQALSMVWDFAECNPFSSSCGSFDNMLEWVYKSCKALPTDAKGGNAQQTDAQSDCGLRNHMISTDPPYYDNIGYSDLSDFFYVWMRRSLKEVYPELFQTMLAPKTEELIATPFRHGGSGADAKKFFEDGMASVCLRFRESTRDDIPVTIYYAYKQNDAINKDGDQTSSGWETMLSALIQAGFSITGTWPLNTEMSTRKRAFDSNALSTSVVLVCRKRPVDAPVCARRDFVSELKREMQPAIRNLQNANIAPVDLAQAAIGPCMAVFSKYSQVIDAKGEPLSVRDALAIVNRELDLFFNEQEGDLDSATRFCVELYSQVGFGEMKFGDVNTLATAKNVSVDALAAQGILYARKGTVRLTERSELPSLDAKNDEYVWALCQKLVDAMEKNGVEGCAKLLVNRLGAKVERAKALAYRLHDVAEKNHWTQEAYAHNALVFAWAEIQSRAALLQSKAVSQKEMF